MCVDVVLLDSGNKARGARVKFRSWPFLFSRNIAGSPGSRDKAKGLTNKGKQGRPSKRARRRAGSRRAIHPFNSATFSPFQVLLSGGILEGRYQSPRIIQIPSRIPIPPKYFPSLLWSLLTCANLATMVQPPDCTYHS